MQRRISTVGASKLLEAGRRSRSRVYLENAGRGCGRIAEEQDVIAARHAPDALFEDPVLRAIVEVLLRCGDSCRRQRQRGSVLVPFSGQSTTGRPSSSPPGSREYGCPAAAGRPAGRSGDASRLLANASLAVQRSLRIAAEPLLVEPGAGDWSDRRARLRRSRGLTDRWRKDGLGPVRSALAATPSTPVLLVRRGLRPGGLAPRESYTRFSPGRSAGT